MESFRNIFNKLQCFSKHLIALCMVIMMTVIFVQTMTRYVVFYSIPWSEELSRYLYVTLTLLGVNLAVTSKQLVRIDIIDNFVKGNTLNVIRCVLAFVITVIFFYNTVKGRIMKYHLTVFIKCVIVLRHKAICFADIVFLSMDNMEGTIYIVVIPIDLD